ncbi:hypothetical protein K9L97_01870 [Candidatus Woesearchaeota archaeon]|nr:hypothetical protein [Candidatus Woesearchaeota archaeon]
MKKINTKKAQAVSIDMVVGVVIFLLILVIVYAVLNSNTTENEKLNTEADNIVSKLDRTTAQAYGLPSVIQESEITEENLALLYSSNYEEIRSKLGLPANTEFCIVVVDELGAIKTYGSNNSIGNKNDELTIGENVICGQNGN